MTGLGLNTLLLIKYKNIAFKIFKYKYTCSNTNTLIQKQIHLFKNKYVPLKFQMHRVNLNMLYQRGRIYSTACQLHIFFFFLYLVLCIIKYFLCELNGEKWVGLGTYAFTDIYDP